MAASALYECKVTYSHRSPLKADLVTFSKDSCRGFCAGRSVQGDLWLGGRFVPQERSVCANIWTFQFNFSLAIFPNRNCHTQDPWAVCLNYANKNRNIVTLVHFILHTQKSEKSVGAAFNLTLKQDVCVTHRHCGCCRLETNQVLLTDIQEWLYKTRNPYYSDLSFSCTRLLLLLKQLQK